MWLTFCGVSVHQRTPLRPVSLANLARERLDFVTGGAVGAAASGNLLAISASRLFSSTLECNTRSRSELVRQPKYRMIFSKIRLTLIQDFTKTNESTTKRYIESVARARNRRFWKTTYHNSVQ
eukprot:m.860303 g.860303  ORF g.860303 m.860303 type:complete len:123 (+) comp23528_c0_seq10:92-460(+)